MREGVYYMDQNTDSIAKVNTSYTADNIKILEGLEAVRKRPDYWAYKSGCAPR